MNMFKAVKAKSIKEYIDLVPEDRKESIIFLHSFIRKAVPGLKPHFAGNMLGYGSFPYKNYKKEMIEWPVIALANQRQYISIYVCAVSAGRYVAEKYKKELGRVKVGRSCISFRKLEDLDLSVLKQVFKEAAKHPGLTNIKPKKK